MPRAPPVIRATFVIIDNRQLKIDNYPERCPRLSTTFCESLSIIRYQLSISLAARVMLESAIMNTDPLSFEDRPTLRSPILLLSFAGWSDAGASATTAVRYLADQLMAKKFATIDPEEFYDFYRQRPVVRLNENKVREI